MSQPQKVRIVSDGTPQGTRVLDACGDPIKHGHTGIIRIEIEPITANSVVKATITFEDVFLDIDAAATLGP
jgi:hypothetical protein